MHQRRIASIKKRGQGQGPCGTFDEEEHTRFFANKKKIHVIKQASKHPTISFFQIGNLKSRGTTRNCSRNLSQSALASATKVCSNQHIHLCPRSLKPKHSPNQTPPPRLNTRHVACISVRGKPSLRESSGRIKRLRRKSSPCKFASNFICGRKSDLGRDKFQTDFKNHMSYK